MSPKELLARHLDEASRVAQNQIIRGKQLPQRMRENLMSKGCLLEITKGWYALVPPGTKTGDTALWHGTFWNFLSLYLADRFGDDYCLSAEASLDRWAGETKTPQQLVIITTRGGSGVTELEHGTSIVTYRDPERFPEPREQIEGINVMSKGMALARAPLSYYQKSHLSAQIVLKSTEAVEIAREILRQGKVSHANRILGGLLAMEETVKTSSILATLRAAGFAAKPENPFVETPVLTASVMMRSPHAGRIEGMWARMRETVETRFPAPPENRLSPTEYLARVEDIYNVDAYHSLSIEGYRVTPELIEKVRSGNFDSEDQEGKAELNRLAALGYRRAFKNVERSVASILDGAHPGEVAERDLQGWYQQLFAPAVEAGFVQTYTLAGYRERRVFISNSQHVPPPKEAVTDCMEILFRLLREEPHAGVRAVLGHFAFVFIHPYSDGNGRVGRFLMNTMLAAGGYPWTVIRVTERNRYMHSLEKASIDGEIDEFAEFVGNEMRAGTDRFESGKVTQISTL